MSDDMREALAEVLLRKFQTPEAEWAKRDLWQGALDDADALLASDAVARIKAEVLSEAGTELLKMAAQEFDARGPQDPRGAAIWDAGTWLREQAAPAALDEADQ